MPQYPIQQNDSQGIYEALNYLLSGPAGLGQNYNGVSAFDTVYLRAVPPLNQPYTVPTTTSLDPLLYIDWTVTGAAPVSPSPGTDQIYINFTSSTTLTADPFQFGDILTVTGVTPSQYNGTWTVLKNQLFTGTTGRVYLFKLNTYITYPSYSSGGRIGRDWTNQPLGTDCIAQVAVQGGTDQPFVSAQIGAAFDYIQIGGATDSWYDMVYAITRYAVIPSNQPNSVNGYLYNYQSTITRQTQPYQADGASVSNPLGPQSDTIIFSNVFDRALAGQPGATALNQQGTFGGLTLQPGIYLYELQLGFLTTPSIKVSGGKTRVGALNTNQYTGFLTYNDNVPGSSLQMGVPGTVGTYAGITPQLIAPVNSATRNIPAGNQAQVTITVTAVSGLAEYVIGQTVSITVTTPGGPVVADNVYPNNQLNGYKPGDILAIPGSLIGGTDATNTLLLEVQSTVYPGNIRAKTVSAGVRSLAAQVIKN
jgi:hypothetical protein